LEKFFRSIVGPTGNSITLSRRDGLILATYPRTSQSVAAEALLPTAASLSSDLENMRPVVSTVDGVKRLVGAHALSDTPVLLSYGIDYSVIFDEWISDFTLYSSVALISILVLSIVSFIAVRSERRKALAVEAWQAEATRRAEAEAEAIRMGKYEALGTLAGGIAHHFNNLLPALSGHLEMALQELDATSPAMPRLGRLLVEIGDARRIIRNILLYSRRDITAFELVDLSLVARNAAERFRGRMSRGTHLETEIAPGIQVFGGAVQLSELITNLLSNANDALDTQPGTIKLSIDMVKRDGKAGNTAPYDARLVCADTGSGMSAEVLDRALDPFFTTKPPGSGSGLGLAICDGIVRTHDGQISVESAVGKGTTVTVLLPLASGKEG
jgi:two-component system, NtrC family, sensor kinase